MRRNKKSSFTIIELLMALSVFTFVVLSALGIYTTTIQKHYEAQKIQLVVEELRWPMEMMAKDIKRSLVMGKSEDSSKKIYYLYLAPPDNNEYYTNCAKGKENVNSSNCLTYKIDTSKGVIQVKDPARGDSDFISLTSSKIVIQSGSKFQISAAAKGESGFDSDNPMVTILIKAQAANDPKGVSQITLQTTANQDSPENHFQGVIY